MSFSIGLDAAELDDLLDELGDAAETAARPAAQAATQVLYAEVKKNVGKLGKVTGNLDRSIYQAYSQENSRPGVATYHISWNARKAPHGHLVEYGHIQRYKYYRGNDGKIRPMVRPGMDGQRPPSKHAAQAEKDAYYVTLPTPIQVPAKSFVRNARAKFPEAVKAAEDELLKRIMKG